MPRPDLTARYIELVEQLGDKTGRARGWRRRAAEQLGINESTLSKILNGTRVVGMDLAERAIERLKLRSDYFWTDRLQSDKSAQTLVEGGTSLATLISKFEGRTASVTDIYALAKAVVESPAILQAQQILKTRKPRSEQEIGSLFLAASKLIDELHRSV